MIIIYTTMSFVNLCEKIFYYDSGFIYILRLFHMLFVYIVFSCNKGRPYLFYNSLDPVQVFRLDYVHN